MKRVAVSADGNYLTTANRDGTVRLWRWRSDDLLKEACLLLTLNLTREEWRQYLGDEPYRKTCPDLPWRMVVLRRAPRHAARASHVIDLATGSYGSWAKRSSRATMTT